MKINLKQALSVLLICLLISLLSNMKFLSEINSLNKKNSELVAEYESYQTKSEEATEKLTQDLSSARVTNQQVSSQLTNLNTSHLELAASYDSLKDGYDTLQKEVDLTITKIESYEREIEDSMKWFNNNAQFNQEKTYNIVKSQLKDRCIDKSEDECRIKTGCLYLINARKLGLEYKVDIETTGTEDKLQSLDQFMTNSGGDCEDYSLFYKAEFNFLLEQCGDITQSKVIIESWNGSEEGYGTYWLSFPKDWYLNNARGVVLENEYIYPQIICGNIFDLNLNKIAGHCVVAFTKKNIKSIKDLNYLDKAPIIEPQDGHYMGLINDDSSGIKLLNKDNSENKYESYIYEVITDSDLFLFSTEDQIWSSYSYFYDELKNKKNRLTNLRDVNGVD